MNLQWVRDHKILLTILVFLLMAPLIVLGVKALTSSPIDQSVPRLDPEGQWARAINQYGIEPVFPPEEDFAVGDLFVQIVSDNDPDPNIQDRVDKTTPFRRAAIKLDHVDVRGELEAIYAKLPFFAEPPSGPAAAPEGGSKLFNRTRTALPIAAFPGVTVSGSQQAGGGLSGIIGEGRGWFGFGSTSSQLERLNLPTIETYGLPSVIAQRSLDEYCRSQKDLCSEQTVRKFLRPIVGERITAQYVDSRDLKSHYAVSIRIFMVNRVYLARAIVNEMRLGRDASGGAQLGAGANAQSVTDAPAVAPAGDAAPNLADLRKRMDDVEKKLANSRAGFAGSFDASQKRELGLDQTFARPVAIGYRFVSYEPDSNNQ